MKSKLVLVLLLISISASAQLIHVEGTKAIGLEAGYVKNGFNVSSSITMYEKNSFAFRGSLDYERVDFTLSKASIIYVNPELLYNFYTHGENFFISAKGGLLSGVEFLSNSELDQKMSQFFVGENIGLCVEYYISNKIMLNLDLDQRFFQLSSVGKASYVIKFGVNFNF
jgi:hypothetical protein